MKKYLKHILVVEGKEDAAFLSNYIESEIVVLNGYELSNPTIDYLKNKTVIVLTDPDEAGLNIRKKLNAILDQVINVEIDITKCSRGIKNGVAECDINEILTKLSPFFIENIESKELINNIDLYNLGVSQNKVLREFICQELKLGKCNNKKLIQRLNNNRIDLDTIKTIVKKYKDGN